MEIIRGKEHRGGSGRVLVLGTFDGVHRGHQELLRLGRLRAAAERVPLRVYAFDRHPLEVIRPEAAPPLLTTETEKAEKLAEFGADELRLLPFDRETAGWTPEAFLRFLREEQEVRAVVAGWNYSFGRGGAGNAEVLQADGARHGYAVIIVPSVRTAGGEVISSTAVREKLLAGEDAAAREMLGYPYFLTGTVVGGKHLGRRIGSPTANIRTDPRKLLPAYGVYACRLRCGGQVWDAVTNIGLQPTAPSGGVTVEAHVLSGAPDLYGCEVKLELYRFLRLERRFDTVEALEEQIQRDIARTREVLSAPGGMDAEMKQNG